MTLVAERSAVQGIAPDADEVSQPQRVLIVDEHQLMQRGIRALLLDQPWVASCQIAATAEAAWRVVQQHQPQLVLVSTSLRDRSGLELCQAIRTRMPDAKVVLMSGEGRLPAALAMAHGAVGSLSKTMPAAVLVAAIKRVADGVRVLPVESRPPAKQLSKRELDVLHRLAAGMSNPEMAALLNLSRHTVKQHTSTVYRKLGVRNRAEAASRAREMGLLA